MSKIVDILGGIIAGGIAFGLMYIVFSMFLSFLFVGLDGFIGLLTFSITEQTSSFLSLIFRFFVLLYLIFVIKYICDTLYRKD